MPTNRAEVCTDSAGVCTVGWTGDDLPPEPDFGALRMELARLRAERGWTYDQLADRTGLSRRTLIEIEQGRTIGTLGTWHALAHALDTSFDQLLGALCTDHDAPGTPGA